jgi:hypothetical protein
MVAATVDGCAVGAAEDPNLRSRHLPVKIPPTVYLAEKKRDAYPKS